MQSQNHNMVQGNIKKKKTTQEFKSLGWQTLETSS